MKKLIILPFLLALGACGGQPSSAPSSTAPAVAPGAPKSADTGDSGKVVAVVDGESITEGQLDERVASQLARVETQIYEIKKRGVDSIVEERLIKKEAEKRKITVQELIKIEVNDKVGNITDKEVEEFYELNKARFANKKLEEMKGPLKQQIFARKSSIYRANFIDRLLDKADIQVNLVRPTVDVSVDDDPMLGNKNAAVTIIEFTDFQCPFCSKARPTVKELLSKYDDKIRYVLRDYPLDFHPNAQKASEAAQCAADQDKYWPYSDILWANQRALDVASLKKYAAEVKLDQKKFDECLDSGKYTEEVKKDFADGAKAGVNGTPSFFINGQMLTGSRPIEQFQEIIDEQLREAKRKKSS